MKKFGRKGHPAGSGKRCLALLMSVCLIGTMIPVTARAENGSTEVALSENKVITDWEWVDDWEIIDPDSGNVLLPFASAENVAYFDDIVEMLPTAISAGGEELALGEWGCEDYPVESGAYEGEYVFETTLPDGYALPEGGNVLRLNVVLGDPEEANAAVTFSSGHTHCRCGATHNDIGDHTAGESLEWQPWGSWESGSSFPTESGNYYLTEDVNLYLQNAGWWEIEAGITINLCLNGHKISAGNICFAQVDNGGKLVITDCVGTGYITIGYAQNNYEHCVKVNSGGEFYLFGGKLQDFNRIVENSGTFRMYGGTLFGNKGGIDYGGGVYNKGTFYMYGGTISDCSLNSTSYYGGGGVYNEGTVYMSGGSIANCGLSMISSSATVYAQGSGVYNEGTFNMSGGSITGNKAYAAKNVGRNTYGCGFYNLGTLNLSGNVNISGNVIGYTNGTPSNLLIGTEGSTNITGNLDSNATIGVTHVNGVGTVAKVAQGVTAEASCFILDDDTAWKVGKDSSGNIILKDANLVVVTGTVKVGDAFISGATLSFQNESFNGSCTTDSSGNYVMDIYPGTYQVSLTLPGFAQVTDLGTTTLNSDIQQTYNVVKAAEELPGTMQVSYLDQNGNVQQHLCQLLTENSKELNASYCGGWYAVWGELTIGDRIAVNGDVHLILIDGCDFNATNGICVESDSNSLTIYGQTEGSGKLTATGNRFGAGIGSGESGAADITINGGTVNATGGESGAGIGSGKSGAADITINDGTVNATGGSLGAGIGGGEYSEKDVTVKGKITINGGTVNATGGAVAPGIGGGFFGNMESITINGGTVNAVAGADLAQPGHKRIVPGIGSGYCGSVGSITISGGTVTAIGDIGGLGYGFSKTPTMVDSVLWKVSVGSNGDSLAGVEKNNVTDSTYTGNKAVKIEACVNHEADSCTAGPDNTHSGTCKWCNTAFTEPHSSDQYVADNTSKEISVSCGACGTKFASYMLIAPDEESLIYNGTPKKAIVKDTISNSTVTDVSITYTKEGDESFTGFPIYVGIYTASISLTDSKGTKTVSVNYEIQQATPNIGTVSAEVLKDTLDISAVQFSRSDETVAGTVSLKEGTTLHYGINDCEYVFTPTDMVNYKPIEGSVSVTVKDTLAPTVSVKIRTNGLKSIFNSLTFGYFFKDTQEIEVEVSDSGTGIDNDKIWYYISDTALTEGDVTALEDEKWSSYDNSNKPFITQGTHFVYVKATDESGNTAYVGTDGIVIYEDSTPATASIEYTYKENSDKTITVNLNGNTVAAIKDKDGNALTKDTDYSVAADGTITVTKSYLDGLDASDTPYTLTVSYNPQGETYKENLYESSGNDLNDAPAETVISITVKKASLTVTEATAESRDYDTTSKVKITAVTLSDIKGTDDVSVDTANLTGTLSSANAGNYTSVTLPALTLTGTKAGNYTLVQPTGAVKTDVTISKAKPEINVGTASYGKTFGDADFTLDVTDTNTEANVQYAVTAGADVVSVSNGTVTILKAGTATITVSLPESTNYNAAASKTIMVNVAKKSGYTVDDINKRYLYSKDTSATIDLSKYVPTNCGNVTYGEPQVSGTVEYTVSPAVAAGKLSYTVTSGNVGDTGTITVNVITGNYEDFTITVNVKLTDKFSVSLKAGSSVTLQNSTLTYGEALSKLTFHSAVFVDDEGNVVTGTLAWKTPTATPDAGTTSATWIFTPDDELYETLEDTVAITVNKATPQVTELPIVAGRTYHPTASLTDTDLIGGTVSVEGSWSWQMANIVPTVNNSGYVAVFTPADITNYNTVTRTITVTVSKATPYIATAPTAAAITYGDTLGASTLTSGTVQYSDSNTATVAGSFAWKDNAVKPSVSDSNSATYRVVFNPSDTENYNTVGTDITLTVSKAENAPNMPSDAMNVAYSCEKVSDVTLPTDWVWQDADKDKALSVGTAVTATAVYDGADKGNYVNETVSVTITRSSCEHAHTELRNVKAATCTETGYTGDTYCSDCDVKIKTGTATAALEHNYTGKVTTEPMTEKEGVRTYTCDRCGHSYTESIPKLPEETHEHSYSGSVTKEPTCTDTGVRTYACSCGDSYTETIPALGHHYVSSVTKQPTTSSEGVMTYTCDRCGHSYTRPIDKLEDTSSNNSGDNRPTDNKPAENKPGDNQQPEDNKPDIGKPYIKDATGKEGWDVIKDEVNKSKDGDTVVVEMNGTSVVPGDVLDETKGKDVTIVFDMGGGITWSVNGQSITGDKIGDIDFSVKTGTNTIPVDIINNVTGERYGFQISLAYDGEFGFTAVLSINMEASNAGLYANLFYYNEKTGELEFICADEIAEDGTAELVFTHASDYAIVMDKEPMDGSEEVDSLESKSQATEVQSTQTSADQSDAWNPWWIIVIGIMVIVIGAGVFFVAKKKKEDVE